MASKEVENLAGRAGRIVSKISGPSAVASIATLVGSAFFYQAFKDAAGAELAQNVFLGGVGLGVTSLVSALSGKGMGNPLELINGLKKNDPHKVLLKTGELYSKNPEKASNYLNEALGGMSLQQREAFSTFVRHESKMSQFRSSAPTADEAKVAKGRDVFRSVTMGISMPRQHQRSGLDRG